MRKNKRISGITLIALVITIIVLLILAGVSIATLTGEQGLISQSVRAKEETEIAGIKEKAELVKIKMEMSNSEIERNELLEELKKEFEGIIDGNRVLTKDEEYAIHVKKDEDLTIEVIRNQDGILADGEFSFKVEVVNGYEIRLMPQVEGKVTYADYARKILEGKTMEEKTALYLEGEAYYEEKRGRDFPYTTFEEYMISKYGSENYPKTIEEFSAEGWFTKYDTVDDMLIIEGEVKLKDFEENIGAWWVEIEGTNGYYTSYGSGSYLNYETFFAPSEGEYTFTATYDGESITKTVKIENTNITTNDDINIYEYDTTTGYITGIKKEYLYEEATGCAMHKYLKTGLTKLIVPTEINGTTIVGIDKGAFSEIHNLVAVELPNTITILKEEAFYNCFTLKEINIPDSAKKIEYYAIAYNNISEINIPNSVDIIESFGIESCVNIVINCEVEAKPENWSNRWYGYCEATINWGQTIN